MALDTSCPSRECSGQSDIVKLTMTSFYILALFGLCLGERLASGWIQNTPNVPYHCKSRTWTRSSRRFMTATGAAHRPNDNDRRKIRRSILEDSTGHINRELAERIWNWEQEHRNEQNLPKLEYSVRSGLRLVDKTARDALRGTSERYSDLVQEGLSALLDAMSRYRNDDSDGFEKFAQQHIQRQLAQSMDEDTSPVRLPKSVRSLLKEAKRVAKVMREESGEAPTLSELAGSMNIPLKRLQDYMHWAKRGSGTLSMESTVEISHPMLEDSLPAYRDQDQWELRQGLLLDNGHAVDREELVEEYLDEMMQREGDDDAWIQQQEQVAGRLQDIIPDTEDSSPDDEAIVDMIRNDLSQFLTSTLDADELKAVRLAFGLDTGKAVSYKEIATYMNMDEGDISKILARGIQKLRASYSSRYVEPYLDDEHTIDSV